MGQFGLTISKRKMVSPSTQVVCLGVLIDSIKGTIQIQKCGLCPGPRCMFDWLGWFWDIWMYHLPLQLGYGNYSIAHLEMVNILLALKVFTYLIRCDNQAVITVLDTVKTRDPYLVACARNV